MWEYNHTNSGELYHYGVKGMKWGVIKQKSNSSNKSSHGKRKNKQDNWSDDAKRASSIQKKSVKSMSNDELRKLNDRTRLEREYKNLNPGAIRKGAKVVATIAGAMGTVHTLYNNATNLSKIGKSFMDKIVKK